jgi:hypothetical protein
MLQLEIADARQAGGAQVDSFQHKRFIRPK